MSGIGNMSDTVLAKMGWKRRQSLIREALNPPTKTGKDSPGLDGEGKYKDLEEFDDTHVVYQQNGAWFICPYKISGTGQSEKAELGKPERLVLTKAVGAKGIGMKGAVVPAADEGKADAGAKRQ